MAGQSSSTFQFPGFRAASFSFIDQLISGLELVKAR
jgi:hypothetical protein